MGRPGDGRTRSDSIASRGNLLPLWMAECTELIPVQKPLALAATAVQNIHADVWWFGLCFVFDNSFCSGMLGEFSVYAVCAFDP